MTKRNSAATAHKTAASSTLWRNLALVLGAGTIALAILLVRVSNALEKFSAAAATRPAPTALSRDLAPYAALGSNMAENNRIADLGWTPPQFNAFLDGMRSSFEGRGVPMNEDAIQLRDALSRRVQSMLSAENPDPLETYFRMLRETESVQKSASGLHYRITEVGDGGPPKPTESVVLSLTAQLPDGTKLPELNLARARIVVGDLLPGLAEGVQLLAVGGKALFYVPPSLAFGDEPPVSIPPGSPVIYFAELHDIVPAAP